MNRWGIPKWLEEEVRKRDKSCIYCGVQLIEQNSLLRSGRAAATWEHIINDASIISRENIGRCCASCNSSKGTKKLADWLQSNYCINNGICYDTVADIVKAALKNDA
jgi:hypothetical protein